MSISQSTRYKKYDPVVLTTDFPITFPIYSVDEVSVLVDGVKFTAFSITAEFDDGTGRADDATVVLQSSVTGVSVEVYGDRPARSEGGYSGNGHRLTEVLGNDFDRLAVVQQEQERDLMRAPMLPISLSDTPTSMEAPTTGRALVWDDEGNLVNGPTATEISAANAIGITLDGPWFLDVQTLLADTDLTYVTGTDLSVGQGTVIRTRVEGFSYVVAAEDDSSPDLVTAGLVNLTVSRGRTARKFGGLGDGAITLPAIDTAYAASGTDAKAALEGLIDAAIADLEAEVLIESGAYYVADDLTIGTVTQSARERRGMTIRGAGRGTNQITGDDTALTFGTFILMAPGKRVFMPNARVGYKLQDMMIVGSVDNGALLLDESDDFAGFMHGGGGLINFTIQNKNVATVPDGTWALRTKGTYDTATDRLNVEGRSIPNEVYSDATLASGSLYFGGGWRIDTKAVGAGLGATRLNMRGFDVGLSIGYKYADWNALDTSLQKYIDALIFETDPQFQYCNTGIFYGRGLKALFLRDPFFEGGIRAFVEMRGGAGNMTIIGGSNVQGDRDAPGGTEYIMLGSYVLGNSVGNESDYGHVQIENHDFKFTTQAGVLAYGGANCGSVSLINCNGNYNGGILVAVVSSSLSSGAPEIYIEGWQPPINPDHAAFVTSRFVSEVVASDDYSRHTSVTDARDLARIVNCGAYGDEIQLRADLDLGVRVRPPKACYVSTGSGDITITLGNAALIGDDMTIDKRDSGGDLVVIIPEGMSLHLANGGVLVADSSSGDLTLSIRTVGEYSFERFGEDKWKTSYTGVQSGIAEVSPNGSGLFSISHAISLVDETGPSVVRVLEAEAQAIGTVNRVYLLQHQDTFAQFYMVDAAGVFVTSGTFDIQWRVSLVHAGA